MRDSNLKKSLNRTGANMMGRSFKDKSKYTRKQKHKEKY